ncbi:similar to lipocalin (predicted) [Rattus norvegicus]|uniref:Similar to lipocalin (Predicted) n=1 Tax=Rattus norvegicus TaxID=10116 RepID=A6JTA1_RAT|nr:similar to lipocalin (predicted) [Rattus norvegicus]
MAFSLVYLPCRVLDFTRGRVWNLPLLYPGEIRTDLRLALLPFPCFLWKSLSLFAGLEIAQWLREHIAENSSPTPASILRGSQPPATPAPGDPTASLAFVGTAHTCTTCHIYI